MKCAKKTTNSILFYSLFLGLIFTSPSALAVKHAPLLKAISENDFNQMIKHQSHHPWVEDYIAKLLKTDLEFADSIADTKQKLALLEDLTKKTSFVPTQIKILTRISSLQKKLNLSDEKTLKDLAALTTPVADPKDCKEFVKKGKSFRDLGDFEQSFFHFQAAFDCFDPIDSKIEALKQITLTHKVKHRGEDFLKASAETYSFAKKNFIENKIPAKNFNKIGIEHVRAVWTYASADKAAEILSDMKKQLNSNYSLQTIYWIYARIAEEKKDLKESQKFLALALREKPLSDDDLISIYWQKFWNHNNLNQHQEAEDALKASLQVGNPDEGQSRTYYWLIHTLEAKHSRLEKEFIKLNTKSHSQELISSKEVEMTELKRDLDNYKSILMSKYPISFYATLINKKNGHTYKPSDLENLASKAYKGLPKNFDLPFYKDLHSTSTLATQSFLRKYYNQNRRSITKEQRFLIKRLLARNGETTELFIELESRPEICQLDSSPCMDLFPKPYEKQVSLAGQKYKVPQELVYSIIRQESIFNPLAKSWADARGLMQLLPSLAQEISKKAEVDYKTALDLYSVDKNISLGSYLIKSLVQEMDNSLVLGLCGYNAEKSRAKSWYKKRFKNDWLKFIEEIPYQETRNYNKLVLRNFLIYSNNNDTILKPWFPDGLITN